MGYRCKTGCGRWGVFDGLCHACARETDATNAKLLSYEHDRAVAAETANIQQTQDPVELCEEFVPFDVSKHGVSGSPRLHLPLGDLK